MIEMATVLLASGILMLIAFELSFFTKKKRRWGENARSFF